MTSLAGNGSMSSWSSSALRGSSGSRSPDRRNDRPGVNAPTNTVHTTMIAADDSGDTPYSDSTPATTPRTATSTMPRNSGAEQATAASARTAAPAAAEPAASSRAPVRSGPPAPVGSRSPASAAYGTAAAPSSVPALASATAREALAAPR